MELSQLTEEKLFFSEKESYDRNRTFIQFDEDGDLQEVVARLQGNTGNIDVQVDDDGIEVTSLMVAAERNDFRMVRYLLSKGAKRLKEPNESKRDTTAFGLRLLRTYRALSSPAYIVFTSDNPLLSAFQMSHKMRIMAKRRGVHSVNKQEYLDLATRLEDFTVELLRLCKNSEQVLTLLHGSGKSKTLSWKRSGLITAREALETEQKKFIGHQYNQHVLRGLWMSGQPKWSNKDGIAWQFIYLLFLLTVCGLLQPLMALTHIFVPCSPLSGFIKSPKSRFVMFSFSYAFFLAAIVLGASSNNLSVLSIYVLWFVGLLLWEIERAIFYGFRRYISDSWNMFGICTQLFMLMIIFFASARWFISEPLYALEIYYSLATIFCLCLFLRALQYLYLQNNLGSMLLSFTRMKSDVFSFIYLFLVVVLSFSAGLFTNYYGLYTDKRDDQGSAIPNKFGILRHNIQTLIWSIFGKEASEDLTAYFMLNGNETIGTEGSGDLHYMLIATAVGNVLFVLFCFLTILILVNLCIAMMSDTFSRIQENIDIEWKFARTKIWMDFIRGPVLPPPYNLIPTFMCIKGIAKRLIGLIRRARRQQAEDTSKSKERSGLNLQRHQLDDKLAHDELIRVLTVKYINISLQNQMKRLEENDTSGDDPRHGDRGTSN
ncbi:transient-receptor-potential-like protein isoform X2 [Ptychodera flava]